jgi:hypothetical protein
MVLRTQDGRVKRPSGEGTGGRHNITLLPTSVHTSLLNNLAKAITFFIKLNKSIH